VSRRVQLVLLCEDKQHEAFARRFLNEMGWETRSMRVEKAPGGRGAGEQFVRKRFAVELKAHRSRPVSQALVVLIDGDAHGIPARLTQLNQACREMGVAERAGDDRVAIFIPTWNIETWLAFLDGDIVTEEKPDYPRLSRERDCQNFTLATMMRLARALSSEMHVQLIGPSHEAGKAARAS
jgi:hypothetical protein